jgi:DNA-binding transcriptional LysR family regulator
MAQQQVSSQIAKLERELGTPLFERSTRRVRLTEAGRGLHADAREVLVALERARHNVLLVAQGDAGSLAVGCGELAIDTILPNVLGAFHESYPGISVILQEQHTADQLDALRRGDIDVGFALLPEPAENVKAEVVSESGFVVAIRGTPASQPEEPVPLTTFRDAGLIDMVRRQSPGLADLKAELFREAEFKPRIVQLASSASVMLAMVAAGIGVALTVGPLSRMQVDGVSLIPIATERRARLCMITRNEPASPALAKFCTVTRNQAHRSA